MTEQKKLRELANNIKIVGTLKEVNLEIKPNKNDPKVKQIMGNIVVIVEEKSKNRIHEHTINLFAKDSSKLYKGYVTIKDQFKSIDEVGKENADRISISGSIDENIYMGQDSKLKEFNRNRGLFINRVDETALTKDPSLTNDSAVAQIEIVVTNIRPLTDKEGIETGEYGISAFTVGYNNGVTQLRDIVVGTDLADVITENYEINSTGKLTFAINNYAELKKVEIDPAIESQGGFGVTTDIGNELTKYVRELRVIGGFPPYLDDRALQEEDIKFARQIRELKVQEVKNSVPSTPPAKTTAGGFGTNADPFASTVGTIEISEDDLPF